MWENHVKGIWWMPRHKKTMKDVAACDKSRWGGKQPVTRESPNGETFPLEERKSVIWTHKIMRRIPGELKHLSSRRKRKTSCSNAGKHSLSSGERKGRSLNRLNCAWNSEQSERNAEGSRSICLDGVVRSLHLFPR